MKVLVTGGHVTPALACIDILLHTPSVEIIFVGRKYMSMGEKNLSLEYQEVIARKIPFINLTAGRLTRALNINAFFNMVCIPLGFLQALAIVLIEKPDKIVSFGGYLALPIAIVASIYQIPVYTHEQTISPGLANRIIGFFAKKVFLSFAESQRYFSPSKTVLTGNPVRKEVFEAKESSLHVPKHKKVLYITGGSLGSHEINQHVEKLLPELLAQYVIIHQTGNVSQFNDYERLSTKRHALSEEMQKSYILKKHILADEIGNVYAHTDLLVSRAGANTFAEIIALHKPAILIPLPISAYGEQQHQAEILKEAGVAEIFDETQESAKLLEMIDTMMKDRESYKGNFKKLSSLYSKNAAKEIVDEILSL